MVPAPDSRTYAFMAPGGGGPASEENAGGGGPAIYIIGEDGTRMTRLNTTITADGAGRGRGGRGGGGGGFGGGNEPQWTRDSRSIYFMAGGGIYSTAVPAAPAGDTAPGCRRSAAGGGRGGRGATAGRRQPRRHATAAGADRGASTSPCAWSWTGVAERRQVFEEAWRVMKNRFYDPKMHGVNWAAAKDTYESVLPHIADNEELHNVIMEMIGEMNASHTGITGRRPAARRNRRRRSASRPAIPASTSRPTPRATTRSLHLPPKDRPTSSTSRSPAGNFILAVNGKELKTSDNYWQLFNVLPGRKLEFLVNSKPATDGAWPVELEPLIFDGNEQPGVRSLGPQSQSRWWRS